jgi:hypothetical protein
MKRHRLALVLSTVFCLFVPSVAHAGLWELIDGLSGPGPFQGTTFEWRLVCVSTPDEMSREGDGSKLSLGVVGPGCVFKQVPTRHRRIASVNVQFGLFWDTSNDNRLDYEDPTFDERVRLTTLEPSFWVRPTRAVEIGAGVGSAWFSGPAFESFQRLYLRPFQVEIKPISLVSRDKPYGSRDEFLAVRFGVIVFPEGFDSADFGARPGFKTDRDILKTFALVVDLDPLFRR